MRVSCVAVKRVSVENIYAVIVDGGDRVQSAGESGPAVWRLEVRVDWTQGWRERLRERRHDVANLRRTLPGSGARSEVGIQATKVTKGHTMRRMLKRSETMAAILVVAVLGGCQITLIAPNVAEEAYTMSVSADEVSSLAIAWMSGNVEVIVDASATKITATGKKKVISTSESRAEASLDDLDITMTVAESEPKRAYIDFTVPASSVATIFSASLKVTIPEGITVVIENDNGDVTVNGNTAPTQVELDNGDVEVSDQDGDVEIVVDNGDVQVVSEGGDVRVTVDVGDATVNARPTGLEDVVVKVDIGNIMIAVPASTEASLSLQGAIGAVTASLEGFTVTDLTTSLAAISGTLNGGGGDIVGESKVGSVGFEGL